MGKVLHVVQSGDRGGVQRHVHDLALGRKEDTAGVIVGSGGWLSEKLRDAGVAVNAISSLQRSLDPLKIAAAREDVKGTARILSPSVVHAHGIFALLACLPLAGELPLIYTAHGFQWHDQSHQGWIRRLSRILHRRAAAKVAAFVAISDESEEAKSLGFQRVAAIPNGVSLPPEGTPAGGRNTIGVATRLVAGKGLEDLPAVLEQLPGATLAVAGDGPYGDRLMAEAGRRGVAQRVRLLGWQDDLGSFYGDLGAYVSLSRKEGLPYAVLDAMAAGKPVVLSDIPGHRQLVEEGQNGFLVGAVDPTATAARLACILRDETFARAAGDKSRAIVSERFALSDMLRRHEDLYEELGGSGK